MEFIPSPIEEGKAAQSVVEYRGSRRGSFSIRGSGSGRDYYFAAEAGERRRYVLREDIDRFERQPDFAVLKQGLIDPDAKVAATLQALREELAILREERSALSERESPKPRYARAGRPRGKSFGSFLCCMFECCGVKELHGGMPAAYDAIDRYAKAHLIGSIPPRERFPKVLSDARRVYALHGCQCVNHRDGLPPELA